MHALLFIPADEPSMRKWMVILWTYCMKKLYKPEAVVHEWADVVKMMADGAAQVVVVARRDHVDWLEVVSEMPEPNVEDVPLGQRRVRRQR